MDFGPSNAAASFHLANNDVDAKTGKNLITAEYGNLLLEAIANLSEELKTTLVEKTGQRRADFGP